jgi:hypothetical protein
MRKLIFCLVGVLLVLSLASAADFEIKKNSSFIDKGYLAGDVISGVLNMSFNGQENLYFTNSLNDQKIKLLELFNAMNFTRGGDYSCEPINCQSYYDAIEASGSTAKLIHLSDEKEIYGFMIKKDKPITSITGLTFNIDVYSNASCFNQIYLDLFNDGTIDLYNKEPYLGVLGGCGDVFYPEKERNEGCFDEEDVTGRVEISEDYYCELMTDIPPAASYEIGGDIKINKDNGFLNFKIFPAEGGDEWLGSGWVGPERLPKGPMIRSVGAIVNYSSLEKFNALVCVNVNEEYDSDYFEIQVNEETDDMCGLLFVPGEEVSEEDFDIDYDLYIKPRGYAEVENLVFDEDLYDEMTEGRVLKTDVKNYLNTTYGLNCSGETGCVIPFSVWGRPGNYPQVIDSISLRYKTVQGTYTEDKVYQLREKITKVSSNWVKLKVEKMGFRVPNENGEYTFRLSLGDESVINKTINVDIGFSFELNPRFAYVGRETAFIASSSTNITSSVWDFNDGTPIVSVSGGSAKHLYSESGEYDIKVTLIKSGGTGAPKNSTKRFKIVVGNAKESVNLTLWDYEKKISSLESDINKYPAWVKTPLTTALGLDTKKTLIQTKRQAYSALATDSGDEAYIAILEDVLNVDLPDKVFTSSSGTLPGDVGYGGADMAHILEIVGIESIPDIEKLKSLVFGWMADYYDLEFNFEAISSQKGSEEVELLKKYKIGITEKKDPGENPAYLIIGYPKSELIFSSQADKFSETSMSGGTYVDLVSNEIPNVEFLINGANAPTPMDLGVYVSPNPNSFGINDKPIVECWIPGNCDPEGNFLWSRFLIGIALILIAFLVLYLVLQTWYKKNYERHLFPNANDLYNLLNFIYNSRRNGLRDNDIKGSLRNRKWTNEQISYAFRKLEGKRTGMWEIPLFKFAENRKVRKELERQQGGRPIDTRFIKRPNL